MLLRIANFRLPIFAFLYDLKSSQIGIGNWQLAIT